MFPFDESTKLFGSFLILDSEIFSLFGILFFCLDESFFNGELNNICNLLFLCSIILLSSFICKILFILFERSTFLNNKFSSLLTFISSPEYISSLIISSYEILFSSLFSIKFSLLSLNNFIVDESSNLKFLKLKLF